MYKQNIPLRINSIGFLFEKLVPRGVSISSITFMEYFVKYSGLNVVAYIEPQDNDPQLLDRIKSTNIPIVYADKNTFFSEVDLVYYQYAGGKHEYINLNLKLFAHIVFQSYTPPSIRNSYVSKWLARACYSSANNFVPLPVNYGTSDFDLRHSLGISSDVILIGRIGGVDSFDIQFVKDIVSAYDGPIKFLFISTHKFTDNPNCYFLDSLYGSEIISFYNAIDWFLHARYRGESFGMSLVEAKLSGIRSIVWYGGVDRNHLNIDSDNLIYYGRRSLSKILYELHNYKKEKKSIEEYNYKCYLSLLASINSNVVSSNFIFLSKFMISFGQKLRSLFTFILLKFNFIY